MSEGTSVKRSPPGLTELINPDLRQWLGRVVWNWIEIGLIFFLVGFVDRAWAYVTAVLMLATRQHALAIMGHDAAHFTVSYNRRLNDWLACGLVFWPLGMGLDGYRKFHFAHHKWTGTDQDPELIHKKWATREWETPITLARLAAYVCKDLVGLAVRDIYRVIRIVKPVSVRDRVGPLLWWSTALSAMYYAHALWLAAAWWVSVNTAYWAIFRLRMMTEHVGTSGTHRVSSSWWQRLIFMPHNTWCHYEHHKWPSVPCWNLPKARALDSSVPVVPVSSLWKSLGDYPPMPYGIPVSSAAKAVQSPSDPAAHMS